MFIVHWIFSVLNFEQIAKLYIKYRTSFILFLIANENNFQTSNNMIGIVILVRNLLVSSMMAFFPHFYSVSIRLWNSI